MVQFDADAEPVDDANRSADGMDIEHMAREYGPRLYSTALRILRNEDDARDAVQDGFVRAMRYADSFEGRSSVYTWLYRIVVNCALKSLKKRPPVSAESLDDLLPRFDERGCRLEPRSDPGVDPESLAVDENMRRLVREAIQQLPDDYRVVVLLRDIDERSTKEVAELLGISAGAVKVRLHRARAALKAKLDFAASRSAP